MGKAVEAKGEYPVITMGMVLSFLASMAYGPISSFGAVLILVRMAHGIGFSAFISGTFSLAARIFQPEKRTNILEDISYFNAMFDKVKVMWRFFVQ